MPPDCDMIEGGRPLSFGDNIVVVWMYNVGRLGGASPMFSRSMLNGVFLGLSPRKKDRHTEIFSVFLISFVLKCFAMCKLKPFRCSVDLKNVLPGVCCSYWSV